jgi:hypothetical protein
MAKPAPKNIEIDQRLIKYTYDFLEAVMNDSSATVTDKARALDRATRLEALKQKVGDSYGSGLFGEDDEEEEGSGSDEPL